MPADQPNVLVLLFDQLRADALEEAACNTPNLSALAADGTSFSRCYGANSVCSPARASLMTGELPHDHGVTHVTHTVPDHQASFQDLPTWGEALQNVGYDTGYTGKWHVDQDNDPGDYGFEWNYGFSSDSFGEAFREYVEDVETPPGSTFGGSETEGSEDLYQPATGETDEDGFDLAYTLRGEGYSDFTIYGTHDRGPEGTRDYYAYELGQEFVEDNADSEDPWCLTVSTYGPHDPFIVPNEYYDNYDPEAIEKPPNFEDAMADKPEVYGEMRAVWDDMDWEHFAEATACYYAFCEMLDDFVGSLLETLEETGQREDTVIVATSDHGDLLGAHRLLLKGAPAFEEAYRVPFVAAGPGIEAGQEREEIVEALGLAPTITDLAGASFPDVYGDSLVPFFEGDRPEDHDNEAYAEYFGQRLYRTHRIVWGDRFKYVFNGDGQDELYDLETDPYERDNLAENPAYQDVRERLAARVWAIAKETGDGTLSNTHYPTVRLGAVGPFADDPGPDPNFEGDR